MEEHRLKGATVILFDELIKALIAERADMISDDREFMFDREIRINVNKLLREAGVESKWCRLCDA